MMTKRSEALAQRVEEGHRELMALIESLSDEEWKRPIPGDLRTVGVVLHHVADVLPILTVLFKDIAAGNTMTGIELQTVHDLNYQHSIDHAECTKDETLALLKQNSTTISAAIRELSDEELDQAVPLSLHFDAPLTTQYFIEFHPLRHSYWHMADVRALLGKPGQSMELP